MRSLENRALGRQDARGTERWRWERQVLIGPERQGEQVCFCALPNAFSFAGGWGGIWLCSHLVRPLSGTKLANTERQGLKGVFFSPSWASWTTGLGMFLAVF